jgi:uncharacterized protein with HEPN domain
VKDQIAYLEHIRDAIRRIEKYTADGEDAFFADEMKQDAVVRNLEIMGQAAKNLSLEFKGGHPEVPWKQMAGTRDKIIHEYFGVNWDLVWDIVERELPPLKRQIESLLQN